MFQLKVDPDLELRMLSTLDAEPLFELVAANRQYLKPWIRWPDQIQSVNDALTAIIKNRNDYRVHKSLLTGIFFRGNLVGAVGLNHLDLINQKSGIGYWLGESYQGKGIMTRAVRALIRYAFIHLRMNRIEIECATNNLSSQGVPARLGFQQEGIRRQSEYVNGHFVDMVVFSLLRSEWAQQAPTTVSGHPETNL
ncbi:GNAT family protein [Pontibacter sp. G13]|uniref:GNAT family N-acetyltransferase n=1 Tax=Pontibacter sp. G13 TaxID=3074898 RepID=UPI00288B42C3|nr:GNAT family protein [Pontibacter sp. G13]WNJ20629.1 GNAT family protein [Pontibacter sp. G13]